MTLEEEIKMLRKQNEELMELVRELQSRKRTITTDDYIKMVNEDIRYQNIRPIVRQTGLKLGKIMDGKDVQAIIDTLSENTNLCGTSKKQRNVVLGNSLMRFQSLHDYWEDNRDRYKGVKGEYIALTLKEMQKLADVDTYNDEELIAKTLFLLMAKTGARISDALHLSPENIHDGILEYNAIKTGLLAVSRVTKDTVKLINDIQPMKDYPLWNNKGAMTSLINENIKMLGRRADITSIQKVVRRGNPVIKPRWELLSCHVARCTFATLMYTEYDLRPDQIQRMMAHSSVNMTIKYIKTALKCGTKDYMEDKWTIDDDD